MNRKQSKRLRRMLGEWRREMAAIENLLEDEIDPDRVLALSVRHSVTGELHDQVLDVLS